ncbi:MAG: glycine zipper 2TM domain-containing protein [Steroidobacteraceae bacterium]
MFNQRSLMASVMATGLVLCTQTAWADRHGRHWDGGYPGYGHVVGYPRGYAYGDAYGDGGSYDRNSGYDYAQVTDVQPLITRIRVSVPRRECYEDTRYDYDGYYNGGSNRYTGGAAGPMILGGIVGAALGNQIGRGDGRRAATVAGAIIGSAIGHDAAANRDAGRGYGGPPDPRPYTTRRCDTRYEEHWEERVDGYRVIYDYHGRRGVTQLPYEPGSRIRVRVDVRPDEDS